MDRNEELPAGCADNLRSLEPYCSQSYDGPIHYKLDANEGPNWLNFESAFNGDLRLNQYPTSVELEKTIAEQFSLLPEQVLVTAGGDESIDRVFRAYLQPGQNLITTSPTFAMIGKYAAMAGAEVVSTPWMEGAFPLNPFVESANAQTSCLAVVSPNNPTGNTVSIEDLRSIANAFPNKLLLLDQAYAEFEDGNGALTRFALANIPHCVVIRSFSKAWGLPEFALVMPWVLLPWSSNCGRSEVPIPLPVRRSLSRDMLSNNLPLKSSKRFAINDNG